jgi:hypothetical protein
MQIHTIPLVVLHHHSSFYMGHTHISFCQRLAQSYRYRYRMFTLAVYFTLRQRYSGSRRFAHTITRVVHNLRGIFVPISLRFIGMNTLFRSSDAEDILFIQYHRSGLLTRSVSTSLPFILIFGLFSCVPIYLSKSDLYVSVYLTHCSSFIP